MINWTPESVAFSIGPITVFWYGIMYAVGLAATFLVVEREARRRGLDTDVLVNGIILVAIAALIGGRLYHVIDQWARYKDDLPAIVLPPYSGLGVYGGILTGFVAGILYARWKRQPVLTWADVAAPGILTMQVFGRLGNFFNQELYGPQTNLPWGVAIDCAHRVSPYFCPASGYPADQTAAVDAHFQPLFLYESVSGLVGAIVLLVLARRVARLRPGDLVLLFFVWYGTTRFLLEPLRTNNWTFFSIPVASIISGGAVVGALLLLAWRHRPGATGAPGTGRDEAGEDRAAIAGREDAGTDGTAGAGTDEAGTNGTGVAAMDPAHPDGPAVAARHGAGAALDEAVTEAPVPGASAELFATSEPSAAVPAPAPPITAAPPPTADDPPPALDGLAPAG